MILELIESLKFNQVILIWGIISIIVFIMLERNLVQSYKKKTRSWLINKYEMDRMEYSSFIWNNVFFLIVSAFISFFIIIVIGMMSFFIEGIIKYWVATIIVISSIVILLIIKKMIWNNMTRGIK